MVEVDGGKVEGAEAEAVAEAVAEVGAVVMGNNKMSDQAKSMAASSANDNKSLTATQQVPSKDVQILSTMIADAAERCVAVAERNSYTPGLHSLQGVSPFFFASSNVRGSLVLPRWRHEAVWYFVPDLLA